MSTDNVQLSDDELLAETYLLGEEASNVALCKALARRSGAEVNRFDVDQRLRRLRSAGLVSFPRSLVPSRVPSVRPVRLTAHGVGRLCAGQWEPATHLR